MQVHRHTAFIQGMFSSQLEASRCDPALLVASLLHILQPPPPRGLKWRAVLDAAPFSASLTREAGTTQTALMSFTTRTLHLLRLGCGTSSRFEGAKIRTVSGIRGTIKKAVKPGVCAAPLRAAAALLPDLATCLLPVGFWMGLRLCCRLPLRPANCGPAGAAGPEARRDGTVRATFEDKPLLSDMVFLRAWVAVPLPEVRADAAPPFPLPEG